jgi:hypothetical protein
MSESFKLKNGQKEYDNYFNAVTVAKAKAEEEETPITICKKELQTFEPIATVHPDGAEEKLDDS